MTYRIIRTLIAVMAFVPVASFGMMPPQSVALDGETYVYICTGPKSERYHKTSECRGLERCSKDIKKVTLAYAEEKGRTPCKICYK